MRHTRAFLAVTVASMVTATAASYADDPQTLEELIVDYLDGRETEVLIAPDHQLARRYSLDLNGVVPSMDDLMKTEGMSPYAMYDYFAGKGAMAHTRGEPAYVWLNLLRDADHFLFSNSVQFSQVEHIVEFRTQLKRCYETGWSYQEFARWALESEMFLNRFPSGADRANASFFLFLGRDSLAAEVAVGNMWNGYVLIDENATPPDDMDFNGLYHEYEFNPTVCTDGTTVCDAQFWGTEGSTPSEAIELMVNSTMFSEATAERFWLRALGTVLPGVEFPDLRRLLAQGFVKSGYNLNWLIREIATSPAYTQEMMFR
jgi:hypothetical protein